MSAFIVCSRVLFVTIVFTLIAHLTVFSAPSQLILASVLLGLSFGGLFACGPVLVTELFGRAHFGMNWGLVVLAPAGFTLAYGQIYNALFALESARQHPSVSNNSTVNGTEPINEADCVGTECYRYAFLVAGVSCVVAVVASDWLARRHKKMVGQVRVRDEQDCVSDDDELALVESNEREREATAGDDATDSETDV